MTPVLGVWQDSSAESLCGASLCFCGLFCSILRRCVRFERTEEAGRDAGYIIDCCQEGAFVCLRRFVKSTDFSRELERSSSNLFRSDGRNKVEEVLMFLHISLWPQDIRTHSRLTDGRFGLRAALSEIDHCIFDPLKVRRVFFVECHRSPPFGCSGR